MLVVCPTRISCDCEQDTEPRAEDTVWEKPLMEGRVISKYLANVAKSVLITKKEGEWCSDGGGRAGVPWRGVRGAPQRRQHQAEL